MKTKLTLVTGLLACALMFAVGITSADPEKTSASPQKKIKALLVTGEGYHDYESQKKIISEGVSKRLPVEWTIWHHKKGDACKKDLSKPGWADPYDVIVYNICHAHEKDAEFVKSVCKVHHDGKPVVALHCTMHSWHWKVGEDKEWTKLLGFVSKGHGRHKPIKITKVKGEAANHPVIKNMPDEWTTPKGELYYSNQVLDTATPLATGDNGDKKAEVCIWVNKYGKAKVFGTTIGHHNETMQTKEYLDLLAAGIQWVVSK